MQPEINQQRYLQQLTADLEQFAVKLTVLADVQQVQSR
jgi:hypothetical protein